MNAVTSTPARIDQMAFPEVAQLRKGNLKGTSAKPRYQGGDDLESKFRIVFYPGCQSYEQLFKQAFAQNPEYLKEYPLVSRIHAMVPFQSVWSAWQCYNEAYQNGRLILQADDKKVLFYKDPTTGKVLIRDGKLEPGVKPGEAPTEYTPKMVIRYQGKDGVKELPTKPVGRLRLMLPEMGRLVYVTLKTTSYYDKLNIEANLAAIQAAAWLNNGVAGGVPFYVFRRAQQVVWNRPDGGCQMVSKWLVCLEIDPVWAQAAMHRMADFALTGGNLAGLLEPPQVSGDVDPDGDEDDDQVDGEYEVQQPESQQHPPIDPPVVEQPPQATTPAQPNGKLERPLSPDQLRDSLARKAENKHAGRTATQQQVNLAAMLLEKCYAGQEYSDKIRHSVQLFLFGVDSMKDVPGPKVLALLDWLNPTKDSGGDYHPDKMAVKEASSLWPAALKEAGQQELF